MTSWYISFGPIPRGAREGRCFLQRGNQGLHRNLTMWIATRMAGDLHRFRSSIDSPSWIRWGSMPVLVRVLSP